ncbi:MAG: ribosomal L7Ae/L30e/S12e/Gadd45 family protein [Oscillospiraceae bacterium]|nr:ribosomal L7Ae/L30e/S12e/Gadd45 family protein [Oscillospiraceae bacterium]
MDITRISDAEKVVGFNQTKKAVINGRAEKVFAANDADEQFLLQIRRLCEEKPVALDESMTMAQLGSACRIDVGCAVCAIIARA